MVFTFIFRTALVDKTWIKCRTFSGFGQTYLPPKEFTLFFFHSGLWCSGNGSVGMNSQSCILLHYKWMLDEMHTLYRYMNMNMWIADES